MKKTGFYGNVHNFSVDYDAIAVNDNIGHSQVFNEKALYSINRMFSFIKKNFSTTVMFFSCNALKCVSMNNP